MEALTINTHLSKAELENKFKMWCRVIKSNIQKTIPLRNESSKQKAVTSPLLKQIEHEHNNQQKI